MQECAGNGEALPHAAGKFASQPVFHTRQAHVFQRGGGAFFGVRYACQPAEEREVLYSGKIVIDADAMAEVADAAVDNNRAFRWFGQAGENTKQGRFARTVASDQCDACAARNFEACAAQRRIIAEVLPDAVSFDRVHSSRLSRCPDFPCDKAK